MEEHLHQAFPPTSTYIDGKEVKIPAPALIRYADDLVVLHPDLAVVQSAQSALADWLAAFGLTLKPAKTRITHTLHAYEGNLGFDFLGFHVRQYPAGKHQTGHCRGTLLGFKTLIKPAKDKVKHHREQLAQIVRFHRAGTQTALIARLNPVIRGWCRYYCTQVSKRTFAALSAYLFTLLQRWAKWRHPQKSGRWVNRKYWHALDNVKWVFAARLGEDNWLRMTNHEATAIRRFTKVQGSRSPYDGDWVYWATRRGKSPLIQPRVAQLLKYQKGRCNACNLFFKHGDVIELDHIVPRSQGGDNTVLNSQLLHRHCHHAKSATERIRIGGSGV
jgi:RNA-directed DNA polymerase